ncbi:hypothetical protein Nos7107_1933 [Nostoc sp. PCC 7107]|nr:hypothetical protein Nos7107_1933 [Nostoc sp. PCC 7107]
MIKSYSILLLIDVHLQKIMKYDCCQQDVIIGMLMLFASKYKHINKTYAVIRKIKGLIEDKKV